MQRRGIRVHPDFISEVKKAFSRRFHTMQTLAEALGLSRSTVYKFVNGKPVDRENYIYICERLGLDWQTIANLNVEAPEEASNAPAPLPTSTEDDERIESTAKRNADILVTLFKNIRSQLPSDVSDEIVANLAKAALSEAKDCSSYQLDETKEPQQRNPARYLE